MGETFFCNGSCQPRFTRHPVKLLAQDGSGDHLVVDSYRESPAQAADTDAAIDAALKAAGLPSLGQLRDELS